MRARIAHILLHFAVLCGTVFVAFAFPMLFAIDAGDVVVVATAGAAAAAGDGTVAICATNITDTIAVAVADVTHSIQYN